MNRETERTRMRLSIMLQQDFKSSIKFKKIRYAPFVAKVQGFLLDEDEPKVIFQRCEETLFPNETPTHKPETYTAYIKDIHLVERA